MKILCPSKADF